MMAGRIETYEDLCAKTRHEIPSKEAHAKGYAAGLEAAAKCAEKHKRPYTTYPENWNLSIAKAIRALGKQED